MMSTMTEHPLADLVRRANESGTSFREMANRARRAGFDMSHSQFAAYAKREVRATPKLEQQRALAAGLDIGLETVRAAVMQEWLGYTPRELRLMRGSRLSAVVPEDLSPEEEQQLVRMIEAWLASREH